MGNTSSSVATKQPVKPMAKPPHVPTARGVAGAPGAPIVAAKPGAGAGAGAAAGAALDPSNPTAGMRVLEPHEDKGDILNYYIIPEADTKLGKGHYGSVTVCYDKHSGRKCAVKSVAKRRPRHITMLKNEVAIMRSLDHPNIIRLYDAFEDDTHVHLVMELCSGGELFDQIIAEQRLAESKAARVIVTLLKAVECCHRNHVVHRDLKPENFLLVSKDPDSDLKVIDFGLSKRFEDGEVMKARVGTPYYIAPEVLDRAYGPECDLWSCGVVLYILLCGYPPFWGDRDQEIFRKVRRGHVSFEGPEWQDVSDQAKHLIRCMLTVDPKRRISAAEALQHPWIMTNGGAELTLISKPFFKRLQRYTLFTKLKQLALIHIANNLPEDELVDVKRVFSKLDVSGTGMVGHIELHTGLSACGLMNAEEETFRIIQALDIGGKGYFGVYELAAATINDGVYLEHAPVYSAFVALSHFGYITVESLCRVLQLDSKEASVALAEKMIKQVDDADLDAPPQPISFLQFFTVMCAGESAS